MYISIDMIIKGGSILGALTAFVAMAWKLFKWIDHQKEQSEEIAALKQQQKKDISDLRAEFEKSVSGLENKHDQEMAKLTSDVEKANNSMQEEQTLVVYGLLACLKGLKSQGCNGPVTDAIDKIDKYINKKAHDQHIS